MHPSEANPVDVHVGKRIRIARKLIGMSQEALAHHLGLTFQQVQKYESGANRISASMLWKASIATKQEIPYFYEGLEGVEGTTVVSEVQNRALEVATMFPAMLRLTELSSIQRNAVNALVETMLPA